MSITFPDPLRIADGTYLIRPLGQAPGAPVAMHVNSLVIQGAEPVIVDTNARLLREPWAEQVFSLVEPQDVKWIFLSHDDTDHAGNLDFVLERCPNATLVTSWFVVMLAAVTMTGQGEALGMAVYDGRWYIAPTNIRIHGGGWTLERVPVDGFEIVALNVTKLRSDNVDPREYMTRLDEWKHRVEAEGGTWRVINDLDRLETLL